MRGWSLKWILHCQIWMTKHVRGIFIPSQQYPCQRLVRGLSRSSWWPYVNHFFFLWDVGNKLHLDLNTFNFLKDTRQLNGEVQWNCRRLQTLSTMANIKLAVPLILPYAWAPSYECECLQSAHFQLCTFGHKQGLSNDSCGKILCLLRKNIFAIATNPLSSEYKG